MNWIKIVEPYKRQLLHSADVSVENKLFRSTVLTTLVYKKKTFFVFIPFAHTHACTRPEGRTQHQQYFPSENFKIALVIRLRS